jgi:hypothetical protein
MSFFLNLPSISGALLFACFMVLFAWLSLVFIKPFLRPFVRQQVGANELVGQTLSIFALFYGLLLGLLSISTYQSALVAQDDAIIEATSLVALNRNAEAYDEPFRNELQKSILSYVKYLTSEGWQELQEGKLPIGGDKRIRKMFDIIHAYSPETKVQETIHADTIRLFDQVRQARLKRLAAVIVGIPNIMWTLVWIGAVITLMLVLLLDMKFFLHLLLSGVVAFFLGVVIFLLISLDNPFRSEVGVSSDVFKATLPFLEEKASNPG